MKQEMVLILAQKPSDPTERRCQSDQEEAYKIKRRHDQPAYATPQAPNNEPTIVHEARKRRATQQQQQQQASKSAKGSSPSIQESRIAKLVNVQGREDAETRVARAIYVYGIPFNVIRSLYWQAMVGEINTAPQGFKGANYVEI